MPATESDRILAAGIEVSLADGRTVALRYSLRSLKAFEDTFGSIGAALDALNGLFTGSNEKKIGTIIPALAAGLIHLGIGEDALYDGLAKADEMPAYLNAINEALDQAFPPASMGKAEAPAAALSGGASTTTPPTSDVTTNGSGG